MQLTINGLASKNIFQVSLADSDLQKTMLNLLREKEIPIASSCRGERICHKCVINDDLLSCAITVSDFIFKHGNIVDVSYL